MRKKGVKRLFFVAFSLITPKCFPTHHKKSHLCNLLTLFYKYQSHVRFISQIVHSIHQPRMIKLNAPSHGKLYKGQTSDLESRIERHNTHESGSMRYTYKQKGTWHLIYSEEHSTRSEAMKRERFLKSGQGREWIKTNILNQQLSWQSPPPAD